MEIRVTEGTETSTLTVGAVIQAKPQPTDVVVENHGSLFTFTLCTDAAWEWTNENADIPGHMWCGQSTFTCEHRYAHDLAAGMQDAGLQVV